MRAQLLAIADTVAIRVHRKRVIAAVTVATQLEDGRCRRTIHGDLYVDEVRGVDVAIVAHGELAREDKRPGTRAAHGCPRHRKRVVPTLAVHVLGLEVCAIEAYKRLPIKRKTVIGGSRAGAARTRADFCSRHRAEGHRAVAHQGFDVRAPRDIDVEPRLNCCNGSCIIIHTGAGLTAEA